MTPGEINEFENENIWTVIIDGEKYVLYMRDDTTDMTDASIQQIRTEEKSPWDDV